LVGATVLSLAGLRGSFSQQPQIELFSDMVRQPKVRPQTLPAPASVPGTVEHSALTTDTAIQTGRISGTTNWISTLPLPVTRALLDRGQERYQIFCAPCHGLAGDGRGVTIKYNMVAMANFHDRRLIDMPDGEIFNTITHGKTLMGAYGSSVSIEDRWAIVAYIRALERSRLATIDDVPPELRSMFGK
jgi:mono/diheme cytochrome c family protein